MLGGTESVDVSVKCGHVDAHGPKAVLHPAHDLVVPLVGVAPLSEHEIPIDSRVGVQETLERDDESGELDGVHGVVGGDEADRLRWGAHKDLELTESVITTTARATLRVACGGVVLRAAAGDEVGGLGDDVDGVEAGEVDTPLTVGATGPQVGGGVLFGVDRAEPELSPSDRRYTEGKGDVGGVGVGQSGAPTPEIDVHPVEGVEVKAGPNHVGRVHKPGRVDAVFRQVGRFRAGGTGHLAHRGEAHSQVHMLG